MCEGIESAVLLRSWPGVSWLRFGLQILADPPTRTPENRGRFVELMAGSGMVLEESGTESARIDAMALADSDDADLFDMVGKVADSQISMMVFRNVPFGSTIGLKTLH